MLFESSKQIRHSKSYKTQQDKKMAGTENNMSIANTDGKSMRPGKLEKKLP